MSLRSAIEEVRQKQYIKEANDKDPGEYDQEGDMAKNQLKKIAEYALGLYSVLDDNQELESWVQSKITLADDYISKVKHYLENELQVDIPEPDLNSAIESCNKEPEPQENNNYAGQGSFYYEV